MADDFKYHIDHHASLVPPPELLAARAATAGGAADVDALRAAEDAAVIDVLRMQRRLGLSALSDGELRRGNHLSVIYDGIGGFGVAGPGGALARLVGVQNAPEVRALLDRPVERGRLTKHEIDFVLSATDRPAMLALPSPGYLAELTATSGDVAVAGGEFARILRDEIAALAGDGVRYVQLRNPAYAFLLTEPGRARAASLGIDLASAMSRMLEADAQVLAGLQAPPEFRVGLDITTAGAADGAHDPATVASFLDRQPFGRLCVEYPAAPAERFPLGQLPAGLVVALGIVDIGAEALEPVEELVGRIDEAAAVMDVDDIAISTNGGFHALANPPTVAAARAKLQRVEIVARYIWGNEL
ncbi:methionine synthase [Pseudofrankia sp. BMG5.36]|uniref:methionine synthase n=1 Tax=Pseudofrankia sp. BMG5.36 TaxID=1834512 RepID=UPI0008D98708|nr:methionine synthase [Pseudofrankia sp. BMG5.36]OHV74327.1 methionine synthase [Pseudofrankia sp. BMG5.36]